jgi:hypothetical protein
MENSENSPKEKRTVAHDNVISTQFAGFTEGIKGIN